MQEQMKLFSGTAVKMQLVSNSTIEQFIDYDIKTVFINAEKRASLDMESLYRSENAMAVHYRVR